MVFITIATILLQVKGAKEWLYKKNDNKNDKNDNPGTYLFIYSRVLIIYILISGFIFVNI